MEGLLLKTHKGNVTDIESIGGKIFSIKFFSKDGRLIYQTLTNRTTEIPYEVYNNFDIGEVSIKLIDNG